MGTGPSNHIPDNSLGPQAFTTFQRKVKVDGPKERRRAFSVVAKGKGREGKGGQGSPGAVAECWAWLVTERTVVSGCVELCFCVCACACFCPLSLFSLSVSLSVANTKLGECTAAAVAVLELTSPPRPCS